MYPKRLLWAGLVAGLAWGSASCGPTARTTSAPAAGPARPESSPVEREIRQSLPAAPKTGKPPSADEMRRDDAAPRAGSGAEGESAEPPRPPKRPRDGWVIFRSAFDDRLDATCLARWTGDNRLEVDTENISRLTLDLTRLPPGAPQRGPWNLQIDKQGIEVTGARGRILDLVRSKGGVWTVDKSRPPRLRP